MDTIIRSFGVIAIFVVSFLMLVHDRIEYGQANGWMIALVLGLFPFFFFAIEDITKEYKKSKKTFKK